MNEKELQEKIRRYKGLTESALKKIKIKVGRNDEGYALAEDFLSMAKNYFNDAKYFEEKCDLLNALAAYSYAHAWLDAGVRAKLFDGKMDSELFALP